MDDVWDIDPIVNLEQTFFDSGYQDGFAHGRIHGLIEGRALGREKGFEMWEELGFYQGFALAWEAVYLKQDRTQDRAFQHIKHLLDLISRFPQANPSACGSSDLDISQLFRQIRSRYKALCSSIGVKHSLRASGLSQSGEDESLVLEAPAQAKNRPLWKLEVDTKRRLEQDFSF